MAAPGLESLMQMVQRVLDRQRETRGDIREITTRLGRLESEVANLHGFLAEQSIRLDRFADRLERVERRLESADG
jgi:predicted nuclease with TOPRIM domain